jgi:hypothetical protein
MKKEKKRKQKNLRPLKNVLAPTLKEELLRQPNTYDALAKKNLF